MCILAPNMKTICATSGSVSAAEIQKRRSSS
jgi:translation initiation factor 1 (eIF-1/SUI1)